MNKNSSPMAIDNHMMVLDTVTSFGMGGKEAETTLDKIAITVNKTSYSMMIQILQWKPSGIRIEPQRQQPGE